MAGAWPPSALTHPALAAGLALNLALSLPPAQAAPAPTSASELAAAAVELEPADRSRFQRPADGDPLAASPAQGENAENPAASPWAGTLELYGFMPLRTTNRTTIQGFTAESTLTLGQLLDAKVLLIMANNAAIGIVTSLFLKSLNSILKTFASALELRHLPVQLLHCVRRDLNESDCRVIGVVFDINLANETGD